MTTEIPENWTFKSEHVASTFDEHVREQLPWYDLVTRAVAHIGKHYIPPGGLVYDIGASTGNIERALWDTLDARSAHLVAIEESAAMLRSYGEWRRGTKFRKGSIMVEQADALKFDYKMYDFGVCFLAFMFFPVAERIAWLRKMVTLIRPGGAFVLVDKFVTPPGYAGTVLRRLAMQWKMDAGASADDIVKKELSLAGYQRPMTLSGANLEQGHVFFQLGEFIGIVYDRPDY